MDSLSYDVFISYARRDDADGWVSALQKAIYDDFKSFSTEPFRIFFDRSEIRNRDDWELRLSQGMRSSRVLLVCLSPNYLRSAYCRWEWEEFARLHARRIGGGDAVTGVYFVELGGDEQYDQEVAAWRRQVERVQLEQLQPWFPDAVAALQQAEARRRVKALGQGVYEHWRQARLAKQAPGNLIHHNPNFVGRVEELRELRAQLTGGAVGVVTAVHGIGGMGKTELALTYAHAYAADYQGGTWYVDADGQTDVLEAVSSLGLSAALDLPVSEEQRRDRKLLGANVLAELTSRAAAARDRDERTGACFLLLDNVSEPELLSEKQLAVLPTEPWFHVAATTRLGVGDIGAVGSRGSVAMIEVDRLNTEDGVVLLREHQPARDPARLHPDFSSPGEAAAARQLVELLDGYTLAVEQAAVYLGSFGIEPSRLLELLKAQGIAALDEAGGVDKVAGAIRHKEKLATTIVDQTLQQLPARARSALTFASLLSPDTIPWQWLQELTEPPDRSAPTGLPGLSEDDWASTRRLLEGRRLLTPADDPRRFARLHRVLHAHLRTRLAGAEIEQRLDTHLQRVSHELVDAAAPDTTLLAVTAATLTTRLAEGRHQLADSALRLIDRVRERLDSASAANLATATLDIFERLAGADPDNPQYQRDLSVSLSGVGDVRVARGDPEGALPAYTRALQIVERLVRADPDNTNYPRDLAFSLERVGDVRVARGDAEGALQAYTRALQIAERLVRADPDNTGYQRDLAFSLIRVAEVRVARGDPDGALQAYTRALDIFERLVRADPDNTGYQRDLSFSLERVGGVRVARGDAEGALQAYTRALQIVERLVRADPDNTDYQRDLSVSLTKVGDVRVARGDAEGALQAYTRALDIFERLVRADPDNTGHQRDLAVSLNKVGDVRVARGDAEGALQADTRALQIVERLVRADPDNTDYQRDLAFSLSRVGDVRVARGGPGGRPAGLHPRPADP
ncbi:MAG: TIR domain-containing protein [Mycobacterium sp.]